MTLRVSLFTTLDETEESEDRTVTFRVTGEQKLTGGVVLGAAAFGLWAERTRALGE